MFKATKLSNYLSIGLLIRDFPFDSIPNGNH